MEGGPSVSTWDAVGAVSSMVSTVTVTAALIYTARQAREARHTRAITALLAVHKDDQSPRLNIVRRRRQGGELDDVDGLSTAERNEVGDRTQPAATHYAEVRRYPNSTSGVSRLPSPEMEHRIGIPTHLRWELSRTVTLADDASQTL